MKVSPLYFYCPMSGLLLVFWPLVYFWNRGCFAAALRLPYQKEFAFFGDSLSVKCGEICRAGQKAKIPGIPEALPKSLILKMLIVRMIKGFCIGIIWQGHLKSSKYVASPMAVIADSEKSPFSFIHLSGVRSPPRSETLLQTFCSAGRGAYGTLQL